MFTKAIILSLLLIAIVKSEGYYCPYTDLGANGDNDLLYDYYESNSGYWTRSGQTGWQTLESYCEAKGDLNQHSDAGEWKCNDSFQLCTWNGNSCVANRSRRPDCRELCQAILDNKGPECLGGNCPNGGSDDNMHMEYCGWSIPKYNEGVTSSTITEEAATTEEATTTEEETTTEEATVTTQTEFITLTTTTTSTIQTEFARKASTRVIRNRRCFVKRR